MVDCEAARRRFGAHGAEEACGSLSPYVAARIGTVGNTDEQVQVVLTVDEVLLHIGDGIHDWQRLSMKQRVEEMGLCFAGLCTSPYLSGVAEAYQVISLEGLIEQFGGTPYGGGWLDQPHGYTQAFSVIRGTRNLIDERNRKAAEANAKGT